MEVLWVSCRLTLRGVDSSLMLLSRVSPPQHPGVAPLNHRGNMCPTLHPTHNTGAIHSIFAPYSQCAHGWVSCAYRFHCSYVDSKLTAAQRGNLCKHSQPLAYKKPPGVDGSQLTLATISNAELIAGAHSFFGYGALQVAPLPPLFPDDKPTCYENDYCSETACKPATAGYN